MTPVRVTAPAGPVVDLPRLRSQCRLSPNSTEHDEQLQSLEAAAVSMMDGYRGILGRCILSQQWAVTFADPGTHRLPFPDVIEVSASAGEVTLSHDALGSLVTITAPATVTMTAAMPEETLGAVQQAICVWVQKRFDGLTGPEGQSFDDAFDDLIGHLRWTRV
ncbi:hypothetical protein [Pseudogemmobacter sonorensis]|uniref:hypothetical protein n=1 Tax=Pseudogemmobacter sonorensis TaxID=2989681 RepID=UPI0036A592DB